MAHRDKNQGFAFVYVDVQELLKQNKGKKFEDINAKPPANTRAVNFNKDRTGPPQVVPRTQAVHQIRENLDRLQALHHKLHAMLHELNHTSDKKKKND